MFEAPIAIKDPKLNVKSRIRDFFRLSKTDIDNSDKRKAVLLDDGGPKPAVQISAGDNCEIKPTIIILAPRTGEAICGSYSDLPPEFKKLVTEQFDKLPAERKQDVGIVDNDFYDRIDEFNKFIDSKDNLLDKIIPFVKDPDLKAILKTSGFAKKKFDAADRTTGQQIKDDVGNQFGKTGRRICNLYIRGYLTSMIKDYLEPIINDVAMSDNEKGNKITTIINNSIKFWENVYFIHGGSNSSKIAEEISHLIKKEAPYIAIHAAGPENINLAEKAFEQIDLNTVKEKGYFVSPNKEQSNSKILIFDLIIVKDGKVPIC